MKQNNLHRTFLFLWKNKVRIFITFRKFLYMARSTSGLSRHPFTVESWVRVPDGLRERMFGLLFWGYFQPRSSTCPDDAAVNLAGTTKGKSRLFLLSSVG